MATNRVSHIHTKNQKQRAHSKLNIWENNVTNCKSTQNWLRDLPFHKQAAENKTF